MKYKETLFLFTRSLWRKKGILAAIALSAIAVTTYSFYAATQQSQAIHGTRLAAFPVAVPTMAWGFAVDTLHVSEQEIQSGQSLSDILAAQGVGMTEMQILLENAAKVLDFKSIRAGKPLVMLSRDSTQSVDYIVYEPSPYAYYVFDLKTDKSVKRVEREVTRSVETASGIIEGSLWNAMVRRGYSYELTSKMEAALKWSVDFHHLQPDDEFRLVYEQDIIDGNPITVGNVLAAEYKTGDTTFYSFFFDNGDTQETGYYDLEGKPMNAGFLKAPVQYARISSHYSLKRFHPVLKYNRPHYGTDYAAPYGTPILAVGNGVVTHAERKGGNGNYVRIRHDKVYETQYLHMQGFAQGIRPGTQVKQGQVIGYVGSTGLATGPHVCFRFWKNGEQVNHLKLDLPPAQPLDSKLMPKFAAERDKYLPTLRALNPLPLQASIWDEGCEFVGPLCEPLVGVDNP